MALIAAGAAAGALLWLGTPRTVLVELLGRIDENAQLVYHEEGAAGTVTVYDRPGGKRLLRLNGAGEVPTDRASIRTFRLLGSAPMLLHEDPREVLLIAFGGGITLSTVELFRPERIDCVELAPEVLAAAGYFADYNFSIHERLDADYLEIIAGDGRNHVLRTDRRYDVIASDSTHPGTSDSWVLYTEEFYRLCRRRLGPDGLMAQWLPLHGLSAEGFRMILRTFSAVFPNGSLWMTEGYGMMLGSASPLQIDFARLEQRLSEPRVRAALADVDLGDAYSFLAALAMDERALAAYVGRGPINTDDRPYISFASLRRSGATGDLAVLLDAGPAYSSSIASHLTRADEEQRMRLDRRFRAREHSLRGSLALRFGRLAQARAALLEALAIDPLDAQARRGLARLEKQGRARAIQDTRLAQR